MNGLQEIDLSKAREAFSQMVTAAQFKDEKFLVKRYGIPAAVLISVGNYLSKQEKLQRKLFQQAFELKADRRQVCKEMDKIRAKTKPLGITTDKLVHFARKIHAQKIGY